MDLQTLFTYLWIGWIVLFIVIEAAAFILIRKFKDREGDHDGGTLSELVWRLTKRSTIIYAVFTLFWIWLTLHFLTGII